MAESSSMNCWEFMSCGRIEGGAKVHELGVCPAYPKEGTRCAKVTGTLCGGKICGSFVEKIDQCMRCRFFYSGHHETVETP